MSTNILGSTFDVSKLITSNDNCVFVVNQECDADITCILTNYGTGSGTVSYSSFWINDSCVQSYSTQQCNKDNSYIVRFEHHFNIGDSFYFKTTERWCYPQNSGFITFKNF